MGVLGDGTVAHGRCVVGEEEGRIEEVRAGRIRWQRGSGLEGACAL